MGSVVCVVEIEVGRPPTAGDGQPQRPHVPEAVRCDISRQQVVIAGLRLEGKHPAGRPDGSSGEQGVVAEVGTHVENAHPFAELRKKGGRLVRLPGPVDREMGRSDAVAHVHPHAHPVDENLALLARNEEAVKLRIDRPYPRDPAETSSVKRRRQVKERFLEMRRQPHAVSFPSSASQAERRRSNSHLGARRRPPRERRVSSTWGADYEACDTFS